MPAAQPDLRVILGFCDARGGDTERELDFELASLPHGARDRDASLMFFNDAPGE